MPLTATHSAPCCVICAIYFLKGISSEVIITAKSFSGWLLHSLSLLLHFTNIMRLTTHHLLQEMEEKPFSEWEKCENIFVLTGCASCLFCVTICTAETFVYVCVLLCGCVMLAWMNMQKKHYLSANRKHFFPFFHKRISKWPRRSHNYAFP